MWWSHQKLSHPFCFHVVFLSHWNAPHFPPLSSEAASRTILGQILRPSVVFSILGCWIELTLVRSERWTREDHVALKPLFVSWFWATPKKTLPKSNDNKNYTGKILIFIIFSFGERKKLKSEFVEIVNNIGWWRQLAAEQHFLCLETPVLRVITWC